MLDEDRWSLYRDQLKRALSSSGTRNSSGIAEFWRSEAPPSHPEFIALVEEILGEETGGEGG